MAGYATIKKGFWLPTKCCETRHACRRYLLRILLRTVVTIFLLWWNEKPSTKVQNFAKMKDKNKAVICIWCSNKHSKIRFLHGHQQEAKLEVARQIVQSASFVTWSCVCPACLTVKLQTSVLSLSTFSSNKSYTESRNTSTTDDEVHCADWAFVGYKGSVFFACKENADVQP